MRQSLLVRIDVPPAFLENLTPLMMREGHGETRELQLLLGLVTKHPETIALINAIEPAAFLAALTMAAEAVDVGLKMMLFGVRQGEGMLEIVDEEPVPAPVPAPKPAYQEVPYCRSCGGPCMFRSISNGNR